MVETSERQVRAGRDLEALVQQLGDDAVAEGLGVTTGALESLKDAQVEMDDETLENLERMCQVLGNAVGPLEAFGQQPPSVVAVDLDQDGTPDVELSGLGMLTPSVSWTEEQEQKRISLRSARALGRFQASNGPLPKRMGHPNPRKSLLRSSESLTGAIPGPSQPGRLV